MKHGKAEIVLIKPIEVNKSITGTINGGGPELELRTFNGSVYVRKGT